MLLQQLIRRCIERFANVVNGLEIVKDVIEALAILGRFHRYNDQFMQLYSHSTIHLTAMHIVNEAFDRSQATTTTKPSLSDDVEHAPNLPFDQTCNLIEDRYILKREGGHSYYSVRVRSTNWG